MKSEPHTTVPQFLALCAAGDPEADAMVAPLVGWEPITEANATMETRNLVGRGYWTRGTVIATRDLPPYATAGPEHPERWRLWGEMWEALHADERAGVITFHATHPVHPRWCVALWIRERGHTSIKAPTPNAALAAALGLANNHLKEDEP